MRTAEQMLTALAGINHAGGFSSQDYFRNPAAEIAKLRSGPVVQVQFPLVGKLWITTTQEAADRII
jgi:hypothetical protein